MIPHVPQPLDHDPFARYSGRQSQRPHVLRCVTHLANGEEDSAAGGLGLAAYTSSAHRLGRDAGEGVDLSGTKLSVGVGDPRHFTRTGAHVGGWHIESGPHEVLADKLEEVASGNPL